MDMQFVQVNIMFSFGIKHFCFCLLNPGFTNGLSFSIRFTLQRFSCVSILQKQIVHVGYQKSRSTESRFILNLLSEIISEPRSVNFCQTFIPKVRNEKPNHQDKRTFLQNRLLKTVLYVQRLDSVFYFSHVTKLCLLSGEVQHSVRFRKDHFAPLVSLSYPQC